MARRMIIVEYSPQWPRQFASEKSLICHALGEVVLDAHHIGSTSVPGLAAKPVIDILLEIRSAEDLDALGDVMERLGYQSRGEFGIPGRRYFPKGGDARTHHVHAFAKGDPHIEKHLAFRDYLREHPAVAAEYAAIKRQGAQEHSFDSEGYVAFKHDFVERTVQQAVHWFRQQGCAD